MIWKLKFLLLIRALSSVDGCEEQQMDGISCCFFYRLSNHNHVIDTFNIAPAICEDPSSLLVPINTPVVFTCKAHCSSACTFHWFINNATIAHQHQRPQDVVLNYTIHDNGTRTHWLALNATTHFNNSHIRCLVTLNRRGGPHRTSKTAILQVVQCK